MDEFTPLAADDIEKTKYTFTERMEEFASSAAEALKDAGRAVTGRVYQDLHPMRALEDVYYNEQADAVSRKARLALKRIEKRIAELSREKSNKEKRMLQVEKNMASSKRGSSKKQEQELSDLKANIKKLSGIIREQERELKLMQDRNSKSAKFKEMEKVRTDFRSMSDEMKVEYAKKLVDKNAKGKDIAQNFLEQASSLDNPMHMSERAQSNARQYIGKASFADISEGNRLARDNNGRSTLENASRTAKLEKMDFGMDVRQSFSMKPEARSTEMTTQHIMKGKPKPKEKERSSPDDGRSRSL